ncbi:MAG: toll/interleukin-1 receptor domain-containing protein [Chloroflexota bacterium]
MSHIFLSHSHDDTGYAENLVMDLKRRSFDIWIDKDIPKGERWATHLIEKLASSAIVIVVMTPKALKSEWVEREILIAQDKKIPIFPLLLCGEVLPLLIDRQYDDVRSGILPSDAFYSRLEQVIELRTEEKSAQSGESQLTDTSYGRSDLTDRHLRADQRLLTELWKYIGSQNIREVINSVYDRTLEYKRFQNTIGKYCYLREAHPEKHFIDSKLEGAFSEFDNILIDYDNQLSREETVETIGGRRLFVPAYKRPEVLDHAHYQSDEVYQRNSQEHDKTLQMGREVLKKHTELVKFIQRITPEFDFQE